jgi:hypothetical protein
MLIVLALIAANVLFTGTVDPLTIAAMLIPIAAYYLTEDDHDPTQEEGTARRADATESRHELPERTDRPG